MFSALLRQQLTILAKQYADQPGRRYTYNHGLNKIPKSAILFDKTRDNFEYWAWETIKDHPKYHLRTEKAHSGFDSTNPKEEMQSSNSSDALLMNFFCQRKINDWSGIKQLLQVENLTNLTFGYQPGVPLADGGKD